MRGSLQPWDLAQMLQRGLLQQPGCDTLSEGSHSCSWIRFSGWEMRAAPSAVPTAFLLSHTREDNVFFLQPGSWAGDERHLW